MTKYLLFIAFAFILLSAGCRSSGKSQDSVDSNITEEVKSLKVLAREKLGEGVKMESSANWVLCSKSLDQRQTVYFVFDQNGQNIVYEESNPVRSVGWRGENELLVRPYERIASETNNDYIIELPAGNRKQLTNIK